jgi:hypothetical protein
MIYNKVFLYLLSIYYLKFIQVYYRLFFILYKPKVSLEKTFINRRKYQEKKFNYIKKKKSFLGNNTFQFLNKKKKIESEKDWNTEHLSKLWTYNLNYFDFLCQDSDDFLINEKIEIINFWFKSNQNLKNIAWDSYPTSLRSINIIKFTIEKNIKHTGLFSILALHGRWLNKRIEYHIQGNHLLTNAKALIYLGLFFQSLESDKWLNKGLKIISDELEVQILPNGAHSELSPMYHSIILEDLLDILNLLEFYDLDLEYENLKSRLTKKIKLMIIWLKNILHPDGEIPFFNDSTLRIAPSYSKLENYSRMIINDIDIINLELKGRLDYLPITNENSFHVLDINNVGYDICPGHAHADTFSFETSLFGKRFIVNSGISTYDDNCLRHFQRSTMAHNTVTINSKNSSEIWKSFRLARRVKPIIPEISYHNDMTVIKSFYNSISNKYSHHRKWSVNNNGIEIIDEIQGLFNDAVSRIYLHPAVKILDDKTFFINDKKVKLKIFNGLLFVEKSLWYPSFGEKEENICLKIKFLAKKLIIKFEW